MADTKKAEEAKKDTEKASTEAQNKGGAKTANEPAKDESDVPGSPVTTATPGNEDKGSPVTTASTSDRSQQPANPAPGPQSTKSLTPGAMGAKVDGGNEPPKNEASDNTPEELTREEEARLEKFLDNGGDDEAAPSGWNDHPDHRKSVEAAKKFQKLAARVPKDTPNEHVIWGAGGVSVTVGDLRDLCKAMPTD